MALLVLLALLLAWLRGRKRSKQREEATSYVVEQLRSDAARREEERVLETPATSLLSLEGGPRTPEEEMREELVALVESQPEDVAALLRGWLVER
jgi:flagellar M-ring protein FliF